MGGPWWNSVLPPEGGRCGTVRMACVLLDLCAPRAPAVAKPCAGDQDTGMLTTGALVSPQGATRKGDGPVISQVQPCWVNGRVRRSPGGWGSQRWYPRPVLGWERASGRDSQTDKAERAFRVEGWRHQPVCAGNRVERWLQDRVSTESTPHLDMVLGLGGMSKGLETWKDFKPRSDTAPSCAFQYGSHHSQVAI